MADAVKPGCKGADQTYATPLRYGMGLVLGLLALPVCADMPDPTRPPRGLSEQTSAETDVRRAAPIVSAVFLMGARPYAVVDGVVVRMADPLAEGRVSRIDERGVWVKTQAGTRLLSLLPDVKKSLVGAARMEKK